MIKYGENLVTSKQLSEEVNGELDCLKRKLAEF